MNENDRAPEFGGDMKRNGGLAGAGKPGEVKWIADLEIGQRPLREILDIGPRDEAVASLRKKDVIGRLLRMVVRVRDRFRLLLLDQTCEGRASVS